MSKEVKNDSSPESQNSQILSAQITIHAACPQVQYTMAPLAFINYRQKSSAFDNIQTVHIDGRAIVAALPVMALHLHL